jgi:hypothetical protein
MPPSECAYGGTSPPGRCRTRPATEQRQRAQHGLPNTIRMPSADTDHMVGRPPGSRGGAGRGPTAASKIKADIPNVRALNLTVRYEPRVAAAVAPVTNPTMKERTWAVHKPAELADREDLCVMPGVRAYGGADQLALSSCRQRVSRYR